MGRNVQSESLGVLGRFSKPAMLILASLCGSTKHGYAIIQDIEEHSGERLGPGTLYGAIARLEGLRLIVALDAQERGRRPYRITPAGRQTLNESLEEFARYQRVLARLSAS